MAKARSKKTPASQYVKYHAHGTVWAKGIIIDDQPNGYW